MLTRSRRPSPQTVKVLEALAADPSAWRYGYELGLEVGLRSGSLYPILVRLCDRDLLEAKWEDGPPTRSAASASLSPDVEWPRVRGDVRALVLSRDGQSRRRPELRGAS